jgi:ribonuclease I
MAKKKKNYQEKLSTPKNAYFFRKLKTLSKAHVQRIFKAAMKNVKGRAIQSGPI